MKKQAMKLIACFFLFDNSYFIFISQI